MNQKQSVERNVLELLRDCPVTRYDDMMLILLYYERHAAVPMDKVSFETVLREYKAFGLPCFDTIRRARQRLQAALPHLSRNHKPCAISVTIKLE